MTSSTSARDDLAFLRALADGDVARRQQAIFGKLYFGAGVIYGVQIALSLAHNTGLISVPGGDGLLSIASNAIFLSWLAWETWRNRTVGAGSLTNKAINAAFAAIGAANLAVCVILVAGAIQLKTPMVATLIPCVIFALQGTAWFVAFLLRRRGWLGAVALGWTVAGVAMAFCLHDTMAFLSLIAAAIVFCMALPGYVMMRLAARPQA